MTAIGVVDHGSSVRLGTVSAGEIAKLWGLTEVNIGDAIGSPHRSAEHHFALPTLETLVAPRRPDDKGALRVALAQLVSLYGEAQKEVHPGRS